MLIEVTFHASETGTTSKIGRSTIQKTDYTDIRQNAVTTRRKGVLVLDPERMTFLDWFLLVFAMVLGVFFVCRWLDLYYPTAVF
ncbi:MAG: hypothetical protein IT342_00585 [Candidatus Melainabacteria bacterium]|nr:hypothetical protein [Candidatus Melainabacteria bacterium]